MRRTIVFITIITLFSFVGDVWAGEKAARKKIEKQLVERGLDENLARSLSQDPRIAVDPDIIIKNLFYSSPRGTEEEPSVMKIDPRMIEEGRDFMKEHAIKLAAMEKRFGTSPPIITAILIVESKLGTYPMPYNVVSSFINMAFMLDPDYLKDIQKLYADQYPELYEAETVDRARRRAEWALGELYHLAQIAQELEIDPLDIKGSFSGALGPAQFIPSTFRAYGIDGDEDGRCNPFDMTDAKLSMAHYLQKSGWSEKASSEQKRRAVWHYNRSSVYVNTIMMLYDELHK
ncbi:MAG: lytic murein transglycosylase [Deltaproteobacteria bacterium]|nr:lytic murein transglycosylase [Deltaproteobacteria bacterium]